MPQLPGFGDLSPAATTVAFDSVIPPLRIPVPAGGEDEPSAGKWVLAFKDEVSWRQAWLSSEDKIAGQCEGQRPTSSQMGARMGCSINATNACKIPWWKHMLVFLNVSRIEEGGRERCEEDEMRACVAASKDTCSKHARETCEPIFADMRIADAHQSVDPRFTTSFRRRRWTTDNKNKIPTAKESSARTNLHQEGSDEDQESVPRISRQRVMADRESADGAWGRSTWSEGAVGSETPSREGVSIEGWEGGLISPKTSGSREQTDVMGSGHVESTNSSGQTI